MNKMLTSKFSACIVAICGIALTANAQYYYKDIIVTAQINANYKALKDNKVAAVTISPVAPGPATDATVTLQQTVNAAQKLVLTYSKTPDAGESWLKSYYNEDGLLVKTVDSSEDVVTRSLYGYGSNKQLLTISSNSVPVNSASETEVHKWTYNNSGQPTQMIKIKDNQDTTFVTYTADEQGNPGEEKSVRKKGNVGVYYYYFDGQHRLTDVARYNKKADRILPDYMFEYNEASQLSQMILVPEGSSDYQTWKYAYTPLGLKDKDVCYNKQKQMVGSVSYAYTFGR